MTHKPPQGIDAGLRDASFKAFSDYVKKLCAILDEEGIETEQIDCDLHNLAENLLVKQMLGALQPSTNGGGITARDPQLRAQSTCLENAGTRRRRRCVVQRDEGMSKKSTTSLSMEFLNASGYTCARVEHWNAFAKVRQDLFGFADVIAYHPRNGILLLQTTSTSNHAARRKKMLASPHLEGWKRAGGKAAVLSWGPTGGRWEEL